VKETRADTRTALLQALGLHLVLFVLMFAGLSWTRSNVAEAARVLATDRANLYRRMKRLGIEGL
jgi:transcriptional regulator of acetoin/glycerol metabolism